MALPPATQTYNPSLAPMNRIVRRATCPIHNRQSSEFVGPNEGAWVFHCSAANVKGVKGRTDHQFAARVDPTAPKTAADLAAWVERQLAARAQIPTRTQS